MKKELLQLENIITEHLKRTSDLQKEVKDLTEEKQDQLEQFALKIIDIIDSFERAEEILLEKGYDQIEVGEKTMDRYKTIKKKLLNLLRNYGITQIEFPDNKFIIGPCEVVEVEPDPSKNDDEIVSIVSNGYIRDKVVIRQAQVIIVKN